MRPMTTSRSILVGYDNTPQSRDALALARRLSDLSAAKLTVATVHPPGFHAAEPALRERAEAWLGEELSRELGEAAAGIDTAATEDLSAATGLHRLAEDTGVDLVVLGSSSRAAAHRVAIGSVVQHLLHALDCPVAVAPKGYAEHQERLGTIAVGFDGSPEAELAVAAGEDLALSADADLLLVCAVPPTFIPSYHGGDLVASERIDSEAEADARRGLDRAVEGINRHARPWSVLRRGDPVSVLREETRKGADLLVIGSRRYGALKRAMLGSVSSPFLSDAPCPVLVVPRPAAGAEPHPTADALAQAAPD